MNEPRFWEIIEARGPYDLDHRGQQFASVRRQLKKLPPDDVLEFYCLFFQRLIDSHTWDLWVAAHLINGGCSEDSFVGFRAWLVSCGSKVFSAAIEDADTLASVTSPGRRPYEFDTLFRLPRKIYGDLTRNDVPRLGLLWPSELSGEHWDFSVPAEVARRLPRLTARHGV